MAEESNRNVSARRRRVKRLKAAIVMMIAALALSPFVGEIVLLVQMQRLNRRVDELTGQMYRLEQSLYEQLASAPAESSPADMPAEDEDIVGGSADVSEVAGLQTWQFQQTSAPKDAPEPELPGTEEAAYKVYLTFDDGPSIHTDEILDILAKYDVKATFFVTGKQDEASQNAIRRIVEEGHTLGMHSYTHKYGEIYASAENFKDDVEKIRSYLFELTGIESCVYRFPGGSSNAVSRVRMQQLMDYLDEQGIVFYDWNISSGDASVRQLDVNTLVRNCTGDLGRWETTIILMHDAPGKATTVEALPTVIENILARDDTVILPITEDTTPIQHIYEKN